MGRPQKEESLLTERLGFRTTPQRAEALARKAQFYGEPLGEFLRKEVEGEPHNDIESRERLALLNELRRTGRELKFQAEQGNLKGVRAGLVESILEEMQEAVRGIASELNASKAVADATKNKHRKGN